MTAAIGFLMIIAIVALLLKGKMSPIVVLAVIPVIAALILGFSPVEVMDFIADGIKTTTSNGILFIFSVIYFGVLAGKKGRKQCNCGHCSYSADRNDRSSGRYYGCYRSHYDPGDVPGI